MQQLEMIQPPYNIWVYGSLTPSSLIQSYCKIQQVSGTTKENRRNIPIYYYKAKKLQAPNQRYNNSLIPPNK